MTTDKPKVIIIRNKGSRLSESLASRTAKSWNDRGYKTELFDAITPDDFEKYDYLDFGDGILAHPTSIRKPEHPWGPISTDYTKGKVGLRHMSGGEKAVYYSHLEALKLVVKRDEPHFIVEHDGFLEGDPESIEYEDYLYVQLSNMILRAGYWHPLMAKEVLDFIEDKGLCIDHPLPKEWYTRNDIKTSSLLNTDGFITMVLSYLARSDLTPGRKLLSNMKLFSPCLENFISRRPHRSDLLKNFSSYNMLVGSHNLPGIIEHRNYKPITKRTAVMVSGAYHSYLDVEDLKQSVWSILTMYKGCDIFWQTWDTPEQRKIFNNLTRNLRINVIFVPEPKHCKYDPYGLLLERFPDRKTSDWIRLGLKGISKKINRYKDGRSRKDPPLTALNQQLSFDVQWKNVPKGYDFYVRTRWDVHAKGVADYHVFQELLELAEDRVIGIGLQAGKSDHFQLRNWKNDKREHAHYRAIRDLRKSVKEHLEKGIYCLLDSPECDEVGIGKGQRWEGFLNDFAIIFKESDLEGVDIEKLNNECKLMPVEYGWHQIFCTKRSHYNIDGVFALRKNIDIKHSTFKRLKKNKLL